MKNHLYPPCHDLMTAIFNIVEDHTKPILYLQFKKKSHGMEIHITKKQAKQAHITKK